MWVIRKAELYLPLPSIYDTYILIYFLKNFFFERRPINLIYRKEALTQTDSGRKTKSQFSELKQILKSMGSGINTTHPADVLGDPYGLGNLFFRSPRLHRLPS